MMNGEQKLRQVDQSTPRMARALPNMPMDGTVMVRLLRITSGCLTDFFEPEFRTMGLTEHGFHVLCLLVASEDGSASPSTLSEMVGTSRANMTRILEQLDRDSWIERRVVPGDGRRQIIAVSEKGRRKVEATVPRIATPIINAFGDLEQGEMEMLAALLRKLVLSLDQAGRAQSVAA